MALAHNPACRSSSSSNMIIDAAEINYQYISRMQFMQKMNWPIAWIMDTVELINEFASLATCQAHWKRRFF